MKNSTLLIIMGTGSSLPALGKQLEAVRTLPAHAKILLVGETPAFPYYAMGYPPYGTTVVPEEWQNAIAENKAALQTKSDEIETLLAQHDVSGEVCILARERSQIADAVSRHAMICDMAIVADDLRTPDTLFRQVVYGVLFQSPIGIMLNDQNLAALCAPKKVLVAWNTQLHSARAVHQALPLLRQAEEVVIATVDPVTSEFRDGEDPGVDIAKWLSHHGCNVDVQQYPSGGQPIGDSILKRTKEVGADLIVMGAYGHSRTREALFGGTTRTLIEQTDQAVFLAH